MSSLAVISMPRMDDVLLPDRQFLEDSNVACQQGCSRASSNLHSQLLIDLCLAASVLLATDRIAGDADAPATFFRASSDSRLDHFVMSRVALPAAPASDVATHRFGSDHKPFRLIFLFQRHVQRRSVPRLCPQLPALLFKVFSGVEPEKTSMCST